jgi:carbonic anhydrase
MNRILQGIQQFRREVFPSNYELVQQLSSGQKPEAVFITCSDSRVPPEWITQSAPGDLFVCRNAGNLAPSYSHSDSVSATIEYAVSALKIRHIVVCGHSDCGAMKGLLHPEALAEMPDVRSWLKHAHDARNALEASHVPLHTPEAVAELAKINVRLQLEHLRTHPQVHTRALA